MNMRLSGVPHLLLCALMSTSVFAEDDTKGTNAWEIPSQKEKLHVFILMGQSNMSGYGKLLPEDRKPIPNELGIHASVVP